MHSLIIYVHNNNDKHNLTQDGHIAMIIGIKRDPKTKEVLEIEVGEAVSGAGNTLRRHTPKQFTKTIWVTGTQGNYGCDSYAIKMDNVYNYHSDNHNITTASKTSDCQDGSKTGGNCYMYTDTYNQEFNTAIITKPLQK